jgi:hypothetical protein
MSFNGLYLISLFFSWKKINKSEQLKKTITYNDVIYLTHKPNPQKQHLVSRIQIKENTEC